MYLLFGVIAVIGNRIRHPYTRDGVGFSIHFYRPQSPSVVHVTNLRNVVTRSEIAQQHISKYRFVGIYIASREDDRIIVVVFKDVALIEVGTCVSDGWMRLVQIPVESFIYIVTTIIEISVAIKFPIDLLWVPTFPSVDIRFLYAILPPCYHVATNRCPAAIRKLKGVVPASIFTDAFRPILHLLRFCRGKWKNDAQRVCQRNYN